MSKPNIQPCDSCKSRAVRYRADYLPTNILAYTLIHARGCRRLTSTQRHNRHRWTPAQAAVKGEETK